MALNNPSTGTTSTNVRQSTRQTRTNPSRLSKTVGRSSFVGQHGNNAHGTGIGAGGPGGSLGGGVGSGAGGGSGQANSMPHGLYPGITHFSDAIDALPREFRRHSSLLSEVDGKAWALEEQLPTLLGRASEMITKDVFEQGRPGGGQKVVICLFLFFVSLLFALSPCLILKYGMLIYLLWWFFTGWTTSRFA